MHLVLAVDSDLHPLGEGIHNRDADTVQAARHLVAAGAELAAGMQHSEHRFQGAFAGAGMDIRWDAAAVVGDGAGAVVVEGDVNIGAMAC